MKAGVVFSLVWLVLTCSSGETKAQSTSAPQDSEATALEDVVVTGMRVDEQAEAFVSEVGAPPEGRKLAVWSGVVCVGSIGMAAEPASFMINRVLDWAGSFGLRTGAAGCDPNVLIVSSDDGDRTALELVRARPLDFDAGVSSSNRGRRALRNFQESGRPVRWWHVSLPVDPDTGDPLARLRGQAPFSSSASGITKPSDLGSYGQITMGSRLYDDSIDHMQSVVIVIDATALDQVSFTQLSDYVAMIALAQIDPDAVPTVPSILNLFNPGAAQEETLSRWDRGYLEALYRTVQRTVPPDADAELVARGLARTLLSEASKDK